MFLYGEPHVGMRKDHYAYVVDARGQERSFANDPSELARNLLRSGLVQSKGSACDPGENLLGTRKAEGRQNCIRFRQPVDRS